MDELRERDSACSTYLSQLQHIQAALTRFVLTDKRLRLSEFLRHCSLREAGFTPDFFEECEQDAAIAVRLCTRHRDTIRGRCCISQNRIFFSERSSQDGFIESRSST